MEGSAYGYLTGSQSLNVSLIRRKEILNYVHFLALIKLFWW